MKRWLGQQCRWHPAQPVFPASRDFYREFEKITALGTPETPNNDAATGLLTQIPYATKQGIILAEQGNLAGEQGILSAEGDAYDVRSYPKERTSDAVRGLDPPEQHQNENDDQIVPMRPTRL